MDTKKRTTMKPLALALAMTGLGLPALVQAESNHAEFDRDLSAETNFNDLPLNTAGLAVN